MFRNISEMFWNVMGKKVGEKVRGRWKKYSGTHTHTRGRDPRPPCRRAGSFVDGAHSWAAAAQGEALATRDKVLRSRSPYCVSL